MKLLVLSLSVLLAACRPMASIGAPSGARPTDGVAPAGAGGQDGGCGDGALRPPAGSGGVSGAPTPVLRDAAVSSAPVDAPGATVAQDSNAQRDTGDSGVAGGDAASAGEPDSSAPIQYNVYRGQTHAHSELSRATHDFEGTDLPAVGFAKARARGADFYFITDHVDGSGSITPADFQRLKSAADAATDATFVAAAGIEYHLDGNEVNMYGSDYDAAHKTSRRSSPAYLDFLRDRPGAFVQWNHPVRSGLPEQKFEGYTPERDAVAALVEVFNGDDTPAVASYQKALDLGWHVGPAAGHDNHGDSWYELPTRTGVLATALTLELILESLRSQRVYASQDPAAKIWYQLNGAIMGSTIDPAASYLASVRMEGGSPVTKVELVGRAGRVAATGVPASGTWSGSISAAPGDFYYARLTSASGARSYTAPVWVSAPR